MIVDSLTIDPSTFAERTGWVAKPEGMCKGDSCVPLPNEARNDGGELDLDTVASSLSMPLIHDESAGMWALGPQGGGRALATAEAPALSLPDSNGHPFELFSLHGRKVLLVAWASW